MTVSTSSQPTPRRFPFTAFPDGWFQVGYSGDLARGRVVSLEYFGRKLAAFRGKGGRAYVVDAFCPHLGAHLGVGGRVVGESLRCPFHGWRFEGIGGRCLEIPYSDRVPSRTRLGTYPVLERNGLLLCWFSAGGAPPAFDVPRFDELDDPGWSPYKRGRWRIRAHPQELMENGADVAHFRVVHAMEAPKTKVDVDGHLLSFKTDTSREVLEREDAVVFHTLCYGIGLSSNRYRGIVDGFMWAGITPVDGEFLDVRLSFSVKRDGAKPASQTDDYADYVFRDFERDIAIWENKIYRDNPVLCDGDGPIHVVRDWARQFYPNA